MSGENEAELTAEDILSSDDRPILEVAVPEWGQRKVRIRALSADQVIKLADLPSKSDALLFIVAASVVDKSGNLLFSSNDIERLKTKSVAALGRIQDAALKLNNMVPDAKGASSAKNA